MKTKTITLYTFNELSTEAQAYAVKQAQDARMNGGYTPWMEEIMESFTAVFKFTEGVSLMDWSIGAYSQNNMARVSFHQEEAEDFTGTRAMAWLENTLFDKLRVDAYETTNGVFFRMGKNGHREEIKIKDARKYGYRVGEIPGCPLTGMCFDESFLEELRKDAKSGRIILKDSFEGLAQVAAKLMEDELENYTSEEAVREDLENDGDVFLEDGKRED
jgi:hypothetical protein